ncbi:MAG: D-aminoacyl-tRNA deacylase [Rothia sp. (in: high G+C Gram-positive bacteria)]|uniref:D-aminoacyl-tRNA deacylase n=1 Tax=Rothia sp. (in: high G+C Gram-positive bacteria) TaxID=1885016 RepID=UPI0026E0958F|nr:D-aminoacyl-tRNA deacylase [Rothia sp. (in: high G+C Gram-positive bacteria)]MDO5750689.1 D-aminoacyl-tRNA deacylase [Rothia sp. (in: high G+C Gram-positive bacteria)]
MRVILQRVSHASVSVNGETIGAIDRTGYLALVGITHDDSLAQVVKCAEKTANLRLFDGEKSALDINAPVLAVSQFTLYGNPQKGRRPSWSAAAPGAHSEPLFNAYVEELKKLGLHVETGQFGADMQVELVNDGPVTLILDTDTL